MRLTRYRFGEFELDPASRELWRGGTLLQVPLKSLECLAYLVAHRERAVGRDELVSAVWGRTDVSDTVITQTMRRARRALDDAGNRQTVVRTVPGFGYRWVAPVDVVEGPRAEFPAVTAAAIASPSQSDSVDDRSDAPPHAHREMPQSRPTGRKSRRWTLTLTFAGVVLLLTVVAGGTWLNQSMRQATVPAPKSTMSDGLVMVLPVAVEPATPEDSWVRLGAMEYAAGRLRSAELKVISSEETLHLHSASSGGRTPASVSNDAALQELLGRSGAQWLLVPRAQQDHGRWRVQLRAVDRLADIRVEAQGETPLRAMAVATDAWLRRIGHAAQANGGPTPLQERLQRVDAELDAGQLEAAREQIVAAPAGERSDPRMLVREGQLEYRGGHIKQAKALFERALANGARSQDATVRAKGLMGMGSVALRQNQLAEAEQRYTQALDALQSRDASPDAILVGNAYNGRGVARVQRGDLDGAVGDLGLARVAMQQNGDVVSAAMVGSNLGRIEAIRNHLTQAVQEYDSAIGVFERYQVRDYLAATLTAKADAQLAHVQPEQAAATVRRAYELAPAIEDAALLRVLAATRAGSLAERPPARGRRSPAFASCGRSAGQRSGRGRHGSGVGTR